MRQCRNIVPRTEDSVIEDLYAKYAGIILGACMRYARNTEDAEDAASRVWIAVIERFNQFDGRSAVSSYLYRMAVNECFMHFRRASTRNEITGIESPERHFHTHEDLRVTIDAAIEQLPAGYKAVFVLHDVLGYEHEEVAGILGCHPGNSKSQLHKARIKLRRILTEGGSDHRTSHATRRQSDDHD